MELHYSPEEQAFRDEVRQFLKEKLPADIAAKVKADKRIGRDDSVRWQKILNEKGWLAQHWPKEYGGTGWSPIQRHIYEEEAAAAGAPGTLPSGLSMVAPVIIKFG